MHTIARYRKSTMSASNKAKTTNHQRNALTSIWCNKEDKLPYQTLKLPIAEKKTTKNK